MILPRQHLHDLVYGAHPMVRAHEDQPAIEASQVQVASIDCRLGNTIFAMRAAALPHKGEPIADLIERYHRYHFTLDGEEEGVLEKGLCYIIPAAEHLSLSPEYRAIFSPKSSTGRNDIFVRVLCDGYPHYDQTPYGYTGRIYLEIVSLSFNVRIRRGIALTQFRVRTRNSAHVSAGEIASLHAKYGMMRDKTGRLIPHNEITLRDDSLYYHIDLERNIVGFEALSAPTEEINLGKIEAHEPEDFWRPIPRPKNGQFVISPRQFYLLSTRERTVIPPEVCGEISPYDTSSGEFRPHYAGFFDNGFGGAEGTAGVLEVRGHDIPFCLEDGKQICRMRFERTLEVPDILYSGNYTGSGPSLSKHFRRRHAVWEA
ncbi:2'-deoxycytidine 5'-triphosphate deaminase [Candidatus Kaiserbacteria bacterium]|nr:2'-deoxycytidine 5'-triphosphate deaminase [Candidatus Kaiserbacteria bacterium]